MARSSYFDGRNLPMECECYARPREGECGEVEEGGGVQVRTLAMNNLKIGLVISTNTVQNTEVRARLFLPHFNNDMNHIILHPFTILSLVNRIDCCITGAC
jgi:hypothetical protein